jgi:hypothetical protein
MGTERRCGSHAPRLVESEVQRAKAFAESSLPQKGRSAGMFPARHPPHPVARLLGQRRLSDSLSDHLAARRPNLRKTVKAPPGGVAPAKLKTFTGQ